MTRKEKILLSFILVFLSTLFVPWLRIVNVTAATGLAVYSLFFNSWREKWQLLKRRKHIQGMIAFFCMVVISLLLSSNFNRGLRYLDPRLPLIYFPLTLGLLSLRKEFREQVLLAFAWLTTLVLLICLGWGIYHSNFFRKPEFLYNDSLTEILGQQSIYISLLVNIAIYVFARNIFYRAHSYKPGMVLAVVFLFAISYLLASRNLMLVLYVVIIVFAFYYILRQKKYLVGFTLLLGLLIGAFLILKSFPKTLNRFRELSYTEFNYQSQGKESHYNMAVTRDQWNGANFRMAAWRCGWELFLASPVKGVDLGDKKDALMEKYREKDFQFALQTQKNVHNNYLDILYSMGLIGLVLFLLAWVYLPLRMAARRGDWLAVLIMLSFAAAWVTEIYFDRSLGGMLTGFFIPFLLTADEDH
jgi:O-antigen ligase